MAETQNTSRYKVWEPMLLAICTVIGLWAGAHLAPQRNDIHGLQTSKQDKGKELNEIVRFIEEKYVDDVNTDALISAAVQALLKDLDPHSGYLSPEEVHDLDEKMEGHFEGIGIEFQRVLDTVIVLHVTPDGPADKAGLKMFDRIVSADDSVLVSPDLTEKDIVSMLRGAKQTRVSLGVIRPGIDSTIAFTVEREDIPLKSVNGAYMITPDVGYIRINRFSATTYKEFMDHLENLVQKKNMQHLILDVRQNPGGYLKEAVNILSQLFEKKGELLVYTEGEHAARAEYHTTGKPFYPVSNIVVLVDEGTASASEILAGAIQDHDRGVVIGMPTYGKGLVQEQYALSNGGALRLTVARYYTPSGRLIQKPYSNGDAVAEHGQSENDTSRYYTSGGRIVNGSGGITPDILIEPDFDWRDPRFIQLYENVLTYAIHGFDMDMTYTDVEDLMTRFPSGEDLIKDIGKYYSNYPAFPEGEMSFMQEHHAQVRMLLLGMIGSTLFGYDSWFTIMNTLDPVVQKALEVIKDDRRITLKY